MRSKLKSKMLISILMGCVGFIFAMLGGTVAPVLIFVALPFLVIAIFVNLTICCPYCGHHLTGKRSYGLPNFCPNCGRTISDSELED